MTKTSKGKSNPKRNEADSGKSRSKWWGWWVNGFLLTGSVFVGLILLEFGARLLLPEQPDAERLENMFLVEPVENPKMVYRILPDRTFVTFGINYRTNEFGFRDKPVGRREDQTFRILCVGDSVTFGTGVKNEETFPNQLEGMLKEEVKEGLHVDVVNGGVSAFNTKNVLGLLESDLKKLAPDVVIYTFVENDLDDSLSGAPDGNLILYDPSKGPDEPHIQREFAAVWWLSKNPLDSEQSALMKLIRTSFPKVSDSALPLLIGDHPTTRKRWGVFEDSLETMKMVCETNEADFLVYSFAARNHSEPTVRRVNQICEEKGIPHATTLPMFDHRTYMKEYSLGFDPHCNTLGNQVMAERLMHFLQEEEQLPEEWFPSLPELNDYQDEIDTLVADQIEQEASRSPKEINLSTGDGIHGMLGGVDLAGRMARSCLFRLSPPGDTIEVEMKGLVTSEGSRQRVMAIIEGATAEESYDLPQTWETYQFTLPADYRDQVVEVEIKVLGPAWIPSMVERRQGRFQYTAGIRLMRRG